MEIANKSQAINGVDNTTIMTPLRVKQSIAANGGSGGTTDYDNLTNKPKINNVELSGNKTSSDLGVQPTLVSGTNIKTINNETLLGSGNISISGGTATNVKINGTSITSNNVADIKTQGTYNASTNKIATIADLPTVPTKISDLTNDSGYITKSVSNLDNYTKTSELAAVATSGSYNDLSNKPTIPTVNNATLTIQKNGTDVQTFTANSSTNKTANITVPTKTSDLTNDSNYVSDASYVHTDNNYTTTEKSKLSGIASGAEVNVQSDWSVTNTSSDAFIKNKPSIPDSTSDLTNDSGYITKAVNDLTNYYKKSETYTKTEVNNLISQIPEFSVEVVSALPTQDISTTTIYLVPKTGGTNDVYNEYIYVNSSWELIGTTQVDLSNYYTKTQTDNLLNAKQNTLVSGTSIKTINNTSLLGSGNISITQPTKTSQLTNDSNFVSDSSYVHTDNNYTTTDKNKLSGIASGAEVNVQSDWNVSDSASDAFIKNKPTIPTKTSQLTNNSGFITSSYHDSTKQDTLVNGTNIKTLDNNSILGSGDIPVFIKQVGESQANPVNLNTMSLGNYFVNGWVVFGDYEPYEVDNAMFLLSGWETNQGITRRSILPLNETSEGMITIYYVTRTSVGGSYTYEVSDVGYTISSEYLENRLSEKQNKLVSGTNIKTINNQSLLGSGNITVGGGTATTVKINGTSITSNNVADIKTNGTYNASTNKIATMSDIPTKTSDLTNDSGFITNSSLSSYVAKTGDTMSGKLTVPQIETGTGADNYFQTRKFRGEGNAGQYYHAIDFGYSGHNQVDLYEYGGVWNFWKNTTSTATTDTANQCLGITQTALKNQGYTYTFPNKTGTFAMASDIPTNTNQLTNGAGFITSSGSITGNAATATNLKPVCAVGSDVANTNGWYKVATSTLSGYGNQNVLYYIKGGYTNGHLGILDLEMRSDGSSIQCWKCQWLVRHPNVTEGSVKIVISGMTWTMYAYQPSSRYGRLYFTEISNRNINGTSPTWAITYFDNNTTKETTEPTATVTSSDGAVVLRAKQDKNGDDITTTYYKASNPNGYTSNTGTITGIKMNGASKGTSGVVDLGTVLTSHQSIKTINNTSMTGSGNVSVQPTLVSGTNIKTINNTSLLGSGNISISVPTKTSQLLNVGENGSLKYLEKNETNDSLWHIGTTNNNHLYYESGASKTDTTLANLSDLEDLIYYKPGDIYEADYIYTGGLLSNGTKGIYFTIFLPKQFKNVTNATINSCNFYIRKSNGGYLENGTTKSTFSSIEYRDFTDNRLTLICTKSSAYSGATNNTPIGVELRNVKITFS